MRGCTMQDVILYLVIAIIAGGAIPIILMVLTKLARKHF